MKKIFCVLALALLAIGAVSAQGWGGPAELVRIEWTLQLRNGQIALVAGSAVYFIPGLMRYVGFIDGLKEGAQVSISGYASGDFLRPVRLTVGEKSYDLVAAGPGFGGHGHGRGHGTMRRGGRGGWDCCGPDGAGPRGGGRGQRPND